MSSIDWSDLFDAGLFIGALLEGDPRHAESFPLVEAAREGKIHICTTTGIISEYYQRSLWGLDMAFGITSPYSNAGSICNNKAF